MRKWFIDKEIHFTKVEVTSEGNPYISPCYTDGFYIEEHTSKDGHKFYHLYTVYEENGQPYWEETISEGDCFEAYYEYKCENDDYTFRPNVSPTDGEKYGELIEENSEP